ncbi:MAG TPA: hypothetical protein VFV98_11935 [Vicinamibacterales bacterium]|nr:hypothetical protein [Vicinamibacterales bacterium]
MFWLDERLVYDGVYSNVGWYGTLLLTYKLFGFGLFTAKKVRLLLHLAGLYAAVLILRRAFAPRQAIVPLLALGLSPALIYFDTLQTSYGVDVWYGAICLALLLSIRPESAAPADRLKAAAAGVVAMIAAMSYPVFVLYLPSLVLMARWCGLDRRAIWLSVTGAAAPLLLAVAWVQSRALLLFDPDTGAGLFRGGGTLTFDWTTAVHATLTTARDVFVRGQSYYFDVSRPDFAGVLSIAALIGVLAIVGYALITSKNGRQVGTIAAVLVVLCLAVPAFSTGDPGLRRSTGLVTAFFAVFALAWRTVVTASAWPTAVRRIGIVLCLLVPIGSALKLRSLHDDARRDNAFQNRDWFAVAGSPELSLAKLSAQGADQTLACAVDADRRIIPCRYQEIYPAIAGLRRWNRQPETPVKALDWKTGREIVLTPELWNGKYYPTCTRMNECR